MTESKNNNALQTKDPFFSYNRDLLLIGAFLLIPGTYNNGIGAIYQALVCVTSCVLSEAVGFKLVMKKVRLKDLSAISTGLIISLLLPACAPLWVGIMASVFAIIVAKLPFGSSKTVPFVPACAGICFVSICFSQYVFTYADTTGTALFSTAEGFSKGSSLLSLISEGKSPMLNVFSVTSILSGTFPRATGAASMLAMLGVLIYIAFSSPKRVIPSLGYILSCAVFAFAFPRVNSGRLSSVILELSAGALVFAALLLLNDPAVCPEKTSDSFVYGLLAGIICMLLRRFAKIEDTTCFGILMINALWPVIKNNTMFARSTYKKKKKSKKTTAAPEEEQSASEVAAIE